MSFVYWSAFAIHLVSVIGWAGGIFFLGGVVEPIEKYFGSKVSEFTFAVEKRFQGFVWMCVYSLALSGIVLLLLDTRFEWFRFTTMWQILFHCKIFFFLVLAGAAHLEGKTFAAVGKVNLHERDRLEPELSRTEVLRWRISMLRKISGTIMCVEIILVAATKIFV